MKLSVLSFGQIATITGNNFVLEEIITDTDTLKQMLNERFLALQGMKYSVAIDKKMVHENTPLTGSSTIALLPPFSGG